MTAVQLGPGSLSVGIFGSYYPARAQHQTTSMQELDVRLMPSLKEMLNQANPYFQTY